MQDSLLCAHAHGTATHGNQGSLPARAAARSETPIPRITGPAKEVIDTFAPHLTLQLQLVAVQN